MIVTKQNHLYITQAIANVANTAMSDITWGSDADENLVILNPDSVDIIAVESEIPLVRLSVNMEQLRAERDIMLSATDWWVLPDRTASQAQLDYRQALRDITNTYASLDDVVWPEKPE